MPQPPNSRARVLLVAASLCAGGSERVMITLSQCFDRSRFEIHLALSSAHGPLLREVPLDVRLHDLHSARVRYALPGLLRLVWRLRPAIILSTSGHVNVPLLAMRALFPPRTKVFVRESSAPSAEAGATGTLAQKKLLYHWFYRRANAVICQSDATLQDLSEQFQVPRKKMVRIYNPLDWERIRILAASLPNPFTGPGPHLVASGRLEHAKGFDLLLDAMARIRERFPSVQLSILGSGSLDRQLREQCARMGLNEAVAFLGYRSNPYPYYRHADAFVLSSRYEGLPNVMMEAMALDTPVVATDCPGGVREIVQGWPNCRLAPPENPAALADAIIDSLRHQPQPVRPAPECSFTQTMLPYAVGAYQNLLLS
jgi:glycosyltransferase involved in cell wall biosynthesis